MAGLEPAASTSRTSRASHLRYTPTNWTVVLYSHAILGFPHGFIHARLRWIRWVGSASMRV